MCTVTYLSTIDGFVLTSNRDESRFRETEPPVKVRQDDHHLFFPRDTLAGGTWIAFSDQGKAATLLNGAFDKHERKSSYSRSRGTVLLEFFNHPNAKAFVSSVDLEGVEPFTLIMADAFHEPRLSVLRWDETKIHHDILNPDSDHIWSSAPLYTPEQQKLREEWFSKWKDEHRDDEHFRIYDFHHSSQTDDKSIDLIMERNAILCTVSVTQIVKKGDEMSIRYEELKSGQTHTLKSKLLPDH